MKNRAVGCAFNIKDLFYNFPVKKLKLSCETCLKTNKDPHKMSLVRKVFRESMKLIFKDVIENNNTFELPTGGKKCDIHVENISGEEFKKSRLRGAFKDVDILASNFSGNQLMFTMYSNNRIRRKPIYLNKEYKNKVTENTNKGKQYC